MRSLSISIPEPCHEDWNKMTPDARGRFCNSCAKTVVDFSAMSDQQVLHYLENLKNQSVCGRVHPDQLERSIKPFSKPKKKIFLYWQYLIAFVLMVARVNQAKAQGEIKKPMGDTTIVEKVDTPVMLGMMVTRHPAEKKETSTLQVVDEQGMPVPGASVQIFPSKKVLITNDDGHFTISTKMKWEKLTISSVGYETQVTINPNKPLQQIVLKKAIPEIDTVVVKTDIDIDGLQSIAGGLMVRRTEEMSVKQFAEDSIALLKNAISPVRVFPNPVQVGSSIQIELNLKLNNDYLLTVMDAPGNRLLERKLQVITSKFKLELEIPAAWSAGTYYLVLQNQGSNKKISQTFIVL